MSDKIYNNGKVRRKEWTTRGTDPTVVVEWTVLLTDEATELYPNTIEVMEFQGVYTGTHSIGNVHRDLSETVAKYLHQALEHKYERDQEPTEEDIEAREAERRAGWDPEP